MAKTLLSTLSVLYSLLLLAIYIAPLATGLIAPEPSLESYGYKPKLVRDGIHIYMFAVSVLFLIYLIFGLSRASSSTSYQGSHASAFVRVGAVFFGLGTIGHLALRLMEDVDSLLDEQKNCSKTPEMLARLLCLLSVVLQIAAIILCSRMKLKPGWGAPYFGLMHMVATNMVAWAWAVYEESLHIEHEAKFGGECSVGRKGDAVGRLTERNKRAADSGSNCQPLSKASEPFFYPFLIEFVLIGATAFLSTWQAIGEDEGNAGRNVEGKTNHRSKPHPFVFLAGLDFSRTRWGVIFGGPVILGSLAVSVGLRLRPDRDEDPHTREVVKKIQYSILDLSGIIAIIIGFVKIYGLPEKQSKQNHTLDVCLLRFGLFFNFLFFLFTSALTIFPRLHCTGGGNGPETGAANSLHLLNGLLSVLYCSLNVLFIELLLHKTIDEGDTKKPGRQVVTFLILLNLTVWGAFTFGLQNPKTTVKEIKYYGSVPGSNEDDASIWIVIQRILIPVIIFFRFHTLVILVECWKNCYRSEEEPLYETTQARGRARSNMFKSILRRN